VNAKVASVLNPTQLGSDEIIVYLEEGLAFGEGSQIGRVCLLVDVKRVLPQTLILHRLGVLGLATTELVPMKVFALAILAAVDLDFTLRTNKWGVMSCTATAVGLVGAVHQLFSRARADRCTLVIVAASLLESWLVADSVAA